MASDLLHDAVTLFCSSPLGLSSVLIQINPNISSHAHSKPGHVQVQVQITGINLQSYLVFNRSIKSINLHLTTSRKIHTRAQKNSPKEEKKIIIAMPARVSWRPAISHTHTRNNLIIRSSSGVFIWKRNKRNATAGRTEKVLQGERER